MLCVPALRFESVQAAAPAPKTSAEQPAIVLPPSVKVTVPVGLLPLTLAVKVTFLCLIEGLRELVTEVVVAPPPPPFEVQASISTMRVKRSSAAVTLTRMRSVVYAEKLTARLTRLLPVTAAPRLTQALPLQPCTWKAVTP